MTSKPASRIAEPQASAGYAEVIERPVKTGAQPSGVKPETFLREALDDLAELDEYAQELDMPPPSPVAKESARAFVEKAVREVPRSYTVSPWDKGKVIVSTSEKEGVGVGIYFNAEGGASCYVIHPTRPKNRRNSVRHYVQSSRVANNWVFNALRQLEA